MRGYIDYYCYYSDIVEKAKIAANTASSNPVSSTICSVIEEMINSLNGLKGSVSANGSDSTISNFISIIDSDINKLTSIKEFLDSNYTNAEKAYIELDKTLDLLKTTNENLKNKYNKKPKKSDKKKPDGTDDLDEYKKRLKKWENDIKLLEEDCKSLKIKIDEYLSFLKSVDGCEPTEGRQVKLRTPSFEVPLLKFGKSERISNVASLVSKFFNPEIPSNDYLTFVYETSDGPTTVFYKIIPKSAGISPQLAIAMDSNGNFTRKKPWELANEVGATFATNFALFNLGRNEKGVRDGGEGIIFDGENLYVGKHYDCDTTLYMDQNGILGYFDNRIFKGKSKDEVRQILKSNNVVWASKGFLPIIDNYEYVNNNTDPNIGGKTRHPRIFWGQLDNGDYIFGACSGRNSDDEGVYQNGMTLSEVNDFIQNYAMDQNGNKIKVRFLMNGDGGGSAAFVADGEKKNVSGRDVETPDIIYVKLPTANV